MNRNSVMNTQIKPELLTDGKLLENDKRLRAIINSISDVVLVVDEDGRYREILSGCRDLLVMEPEELKGRLMQEVIPGSDTLAFMSAVRRTISSGRPELFEYELDVPAGHRWFEGRTYPLDLEINGKQCVVFAIRDVTDRKRAERLQVQNTYLMEEIREHLGLSGLVGRSLAMQQVFREIQLVSKTDSTVVLLGETGTGKELVARGIHDLSSRKDGVLVTVNCTALPAELAESELFGHEKGAFTGANGLHRGKFEVACGGTVLLDEVGELPLNLQGKLLRVLQEQEVERVGGESPLPVDVRVIAATNRNLKEAVARGTFRSDLYYRLNIFPIELPPLRRRKEDITDLARHFVDKFAERMGKRISAVDEGLLEKLRNYDWPGNVRELANVLERGVILCQGDTLGAEHVVNLESPVQAADGSASDFLTLAESERLHIMRALELTGGVLGGPRGAARLLGVKRSTLWSRMQKLGITGRRSGGGGP